MPDHHIIFIIILNEAVIVQGGTLSQVMCFTAKNYNTIILCHL